MRTRMLFSLALAAIGLAGCGDSLSPGEVAGTYAVVRANGLPLGAAIDSSQFASWGIESGTLRLNADGTWRFDQVIRYTGKTGNIFYQDPPAFDVGTFTVDGSRLRFVDPAPGGGAFDGKVTGSGIEWSSAGLLNAIRFRSMEFERR